MRKKKVVELNYGINMPFIAPVMRVERLIKDSKEGRRGDFETWHARN